MSINEFTSDTLKDLLNFSGPPLAYWEAYASQVARMLDAELVVLYSRPRMEAAGEGWTEFSAWPATAGEKPPLAMMASDALLAKAIQQGSATGRASGRNWDVALVFMRSEAADRDLMLCAHLPSGAAGASRAGELLLLGLLPRHFELNRRKRLAERDATRLSQTLEGLGRVLEAERFDQATLAFANQLADLFACEQVAIAWMAGEGLKLRTLSHSDRLEQRSAFTGLLEEAGQEALLQEKEIAWPLPESAKGRVVAHAHQTYVEARRPGNMVTLPLLFGGERLGAVICERAAMPFSQTEVWALRLMCDQVARPLKDLEKRQRPILLRLWQEIWGSLPARLRPFTEEGRRFTRWFAIGIGAMLLLPLPYHVESNFILKTDAMAFVGAPFDGFIDTSNVSLGQVLKAGDVVFTLSTRELMLERAAGLADIAQYSREVEKKRAANQLAEMRVAEAQQEQAQAKLEQVEYRLAHAQVATPIAGVVVEGEPGKNLGGPVKRGDTVVKIAQVDHLFAEIAVDERDLEMVEPGQSGEMTLVASPHSSWEIKVARVTPAPSVKDGQNTFPVRAEPVGVAPDWWRPGMSGVAKISVGYRPIIWMMSHRLLDYLALHLWV